MRHSLKPLLYCVFVFNLFISTVSAVAESKKDAPQSIPGTTKVTAEDIFLLVEEKPDLVIIDARIKSDRIQGYLEGSVSLPDVDTNCKKLSNFISNKTSPILFYCNGVKCGRSGKSSKIALKCGYKNVYWFRGGFEEWKAKKLPLIKK